MKIKVPILSLLLLFAIQTSWVPASARDDESQGIASSGDYRACGANCLFALSHILGVDVDIDEIDRILPLGDDEKNSLAEVALAAGKLGLTPLVAKLNWDELLYVEGPAVLHVRQMEGQPSGNHFVVYLGQTLDKGIVVFDPPSTPQKVQAERFRRLWTGNVMLAFRTVSEAEAFKEHIVSVRAGLAREPLAWSAGILFILLLTVAFVPRVSSDRWWGNRHA
jgi:ABC-type bacteriocin/lantibiotic exporter with double-glycine peptidase domain